jgi:hypothetical protein
MFTDKMHTSSFAKNYIKRASLYVAHKNYRDLSTKLLDKFLYYMLGGYVSGELLDKLVTLKASAFLDSKVGRIGFSRIKNFLGKMS